MTLSEEEINRLFRIRRTVMQMLKDRGYFVGEFEIDMTKEQFKNKYGESMKREDLVINKAKRNNSSDQVLIRFRLSAFFSFVFDGAFVILVSVFDLV
jgi:DNA-directed RNA polymerase I, II, and III subunit RPABC1